MEFAISVTIAGYKPAQSTGICRRGLQTRFEHWSAHKGEGHKELRSARKGYSPLVGGLQPSTPHPDTVAILRTHFEQIPSN